MKNQTVDLGETWKLWQECLSSEDPNSIFSQISFMLWDTAIFRLIIESRQMQVENNINIPELNARIIFFIDRNFFEAQIASIRRQIDNYSLYGNKGVYSLRALLKDVSKYRVSLTRESFVSLQKISKPTWIDIGEANQRFDNLSGKNATNRSRDDLINESVIERLLQRLASCQQIAKYVDKYIAHAATPKSRSIENVDETKITFGHIWQAHKIIYQVAEFLSESLFSQGVTPLPLESPLMFMESNIPIIDTSQISVFEEAWKKYRDETNSWQFNGFDRLWNWLDDESA